jgi:hypothetical protein
MFLPADGGNVQEGVLEGMVVSVPRRNQGELWRMLRK